MHFENMSVYVSVHFLIHYICFEAMMNESSDHKIVESLNQQILSSDNLNIQSS
jgi:hypothetical protein